MDLKSSKLWSSQLWRQFKQLCIEAWKSQDFNGVWTCDLTIPVRRSNQLSYKATDVGNIYYINIYVNIVSVIFHISLHKHLKLLKNTSELFDVFINLIHFIQFYS